MYRWEKLALMDIPQKNNSLIWQKARVIWCCTKWTKMRLCKKEFGILINPSVSFVFKIIFLMCWLCFGYFKTIKALSRWRSNYGNLRVSNNVHCLYGNGFHDRLHRAVRTKGYSYQEPQICCFLNCFHQHNSETDSDSCEEYRWDRFQSNLMDNRKADSQSKSIQIDRMSGHWKHHSRHSLIQHAGWQGREAHH